MYTVIVVLVDAVHTYEYTNEEDAAAEYQHQLSLYSLLAGVSPVTVLKCKVCNDGLAVLQSVILDGNT